MIYKYELIDGDIEVGDKVQCGVFYGIVIGFNKDHSIATVDFSNGRNEKDLIIQRKLSELKRCGKVNLAEVNVQP